MCDKNQMPKLHNLSSRPEVDATHAPLADPAEITQLASGQAEALAKVDRDELIFGRLTMLSSSDARKLSAFKGKLELNGLKGIDNATAYALASHSGSLVLDGLTDIPDTTALALAPHRGPISLAGIENPGSILWSIFLKRGHSPFDQRPPLEGFSILMSDSAKPAYNLLHQAILRSITPKEFKEELIKTDILALEKAHERSVKINKSEKIPAPFKDFLQQPLVLLPFDKTHVPEFFKALKLDFEELETLARGRTPCQILVALRQYTQINILWPKEYFNEIDLSLLIKVAELANLTESIGPSGPNTNLKLWNFPHQ